MEKIKNSDKNVKIHQLKGKPKPFADKQNVLSSPKNQNINIFSKLNAPGTRVTAPILIRYIDPKLVPLFRELGNLTERYSEIAQSNNQPSHAKEDLIELIQSTKKLTKQMSQIIQQPQEPVEAYQNPLDEVQLADSQFLNLDQSNKSQNKSQNQKEEQALRIIQMVNQAQDSIEHLENQNATLRQQLEKQKQKSLTLAKQLQKYNNNEKEKQELKLKLEKSETERRQLILSVQLQLQRLRQNKLGCIQNLERISKIYEQ